MTGGPPMAVSGMLIEEKLPKPSLGYCGTEGKEIHNGAMGSLPRKYTGTTDTQSRGAAAGDVAQSLEFNSSALQKN